MGLLKPADLWRIVKDVDLEGIRASARRRVDLLVVSEDGEDARTLCARLGPDADADPDDPCHPWLRPIAACDGLPVLDAAPAAAVMVSRPVELAAATAALRDHLVKHQVPLVTVILGHTTRSAGAARHGEWARVAVPAVEAAALPVISASILAAVPEPLHLALAHTLPAFRSAVSQAVIDSTAKANAAYALTTGLAESIPALSAPLAIGDMVVLTKNQLLMCYRLVLAHGRDGDPKALVGEVAGVLGGGVLFRQAARQLVGLVPVLGIVPKVAMAYAGTWAVGRAMVLWASEGRAVTASAVRQYSREGYSRGRTVARVLYDETLRHTQRAASAWQRLLGHGPAPRPGSEQRS